MQIIKYDRGKKAHNLQVFEPFNLRRLFCYKKHVQNTPNLNNCSRVGDNISPST